MRTNDGAAPDRRVYPTIEFVGVDGRGTRPVDLFAEGNRRGGTGLQIRPSEWIQRIQEVGRDVVRRPT